LNEKFKNCNEKNTKLEDELERCKQENERLKVSSSAPPSVSEFSDEKNPSKGFKKDPSSSPRSSPRFMEGTKSSKLKRKKGGTFKQYQNKYKYSIKNRPHLKNKSIKNNKRKHTKTYKRK
jgi:hypothetical protein